jgi:hypothetical protein
VGALSDALHGVFGDDSLRYALLAMCPGYLWAGSHLWRGSRTVNGDLERALADSARMERATVAAGPREGRPMNPRAATLD